ncbi:hypothetical protein D3C87_1282120 [compost metagenome]
MEPEVQLLRRAHRLSAARRASGLDRRRQRLLGRRSLQHGRGRLHRALHRRHSRRPGTARRVPRLRPRRLAGTGPWRLAGLGRRRSHPALDRLAALRRHRRGGSELGGDDPLPGLHPRAQPGPDLAQSARLRLRRLGGAGRRQSRRRDHAQGPDRHRHVETFGRRHGRDGAGLRPPPRGRTLSRSGPEDHRRLPARVRAARRLDGQRITGRLHPGPALRPCAGRAAARGHRPSGRRYPPTRDPAVDRLPRHALQPGRPGRQ